MKDLYSNAQQWLEHYPELYSLTGLSLLLLAAWLANWVVKRILLRGLYRALKATPIGQDGSLHDSRVIARLANIVPALIISAGITLVPNLPKAVVAVTGNVCSAFIVLTIALAISGVLTLLNNTYQKRPNAHLKPIKGYAGGEDSAFRDCRNTHGGQPDRPLAADSAVWPGRDGRRTDADFSGYLAIAGRQRADILQRYRACR